MKNVLNNRRGFIKTASMATLAAIAVPETVSTAFAAEKKTNLLLAKNDTILFQGDSITDWGRDRSKNETNTTSALGPGYVLATSAQLLGQHPAHQFKIYNKGIGGQKVFELAARWDTDCIDLKPNVLNILIGVNDFWHTMSLGYKGSLEIYRNDYRKLLDRTKKALPDVKLILMEPFGLNDVKFVDEKWYPVFTQYQQAAREIATEFGAVFIPLQAVFNKALKVAPGHYWTIDGVHPSIAGQGLIAQAWLETVKFV